MQDVKTETTPDIAEITNTINAVLVAHGVPQGENKVQDGKICSRHVPYVLDVMLEKYAVRVEPMHACNRTVNELATLIQRFIMDAVHARTTLAIEQQLHDVDIRDLNYSTRFAKDLCIDSITLSGIQGQIQDDFGVMIPGEVLYGLRTVGDMGDFIRSQLPEEQ